MIRMKPETARVIFETVARNHGEPKGVTIDDLVDRMTALEFRTHDEMFLAFAACVSLPIPPEQASDSSCGSILAAIGTLEADETQRATNRTAGFLALGLVMSLIVPFSGFALLPVDFATAKSADGDRLAELRAQAVAKGARSWVFGPRPASESG